MDLKSLAMPNSYCDELPGGSNSLTRIDAHVQYPSDDLILAAQDRVRKWLHESPELKLPVNSGSGSFHNSGVRTEAMFLSEEDADKYPDDDMAIQSGIRRGCFGVFSCLPLRNRR